MKVIFLDFDGVMDTAYYGHILRKEGALVSLFSKKKKYPNYVKNNVYLCNGKKEKES